MGLDADALSRMKVKDLQRELKKRGLDTSGLKAVLLKRLKEHVQQEVEQEEMPTTEPLDEDSKPEDKKKETTEMEEETEGETPVAAATEENPLVATVENESEAVGASNSEAKNCGETENVSSDGQANERDPALSEAPIAGTGGISSSGKKASQSFKRTAGEATAEAEVAEPSAKKQKCNEEVGAGDSESPSDVPAEEKSPSTAEGGEKKAVEVTLKTLRIDNFVRPFTLNAVKTLVQEFGPFVEDGFWMDTIKTHCYVTYPSVESAEKTSAELNGKIWPPENGRALSVAFVDQTAMEVATSGETKVSGLKRNASGESESEPPRSRQKAVTIDEFFLKTETKPVLYYLPLTDEQVAEREQRKQQRLQDRPPRKRRHRGGRKNRRGTRGRGRRRWP